MAGCFNSAYVDSVYIVAGEVNWKIVMSDMLGRGKVSSRGKDTPIHEVLKEVSRYNPKSINIIEAGS